MAGLTIVIGDGMTIGLGVTVRAAPGNLAVVHRKHILPVTPRCVASTAYIGRISVVRRLIVGVAILATAIDLVMIYGKYHIPLCARTMAGLTDVGSIRVAG
jgi:hypothetical protein